MQVSQFKTVEGQEKDCWSQVLPSSAKVLVMHQNKEKKNKWYDNAFLQQSNSIEIARE